MIPDIPFDELLRHNWLTDIVKLGDISIEYIAENTVGFPMDILSSKTNCRVLDSSYDLILSVGQVVPYVVGGSVCL